MQTAKRESNAPFPGGRHVGVDNFFLDQSIGIDETKKILKFVL